MQTATSMKATQSSKRDNSPMYNVNPSKVFQAKQQIQKKSKCKIKFIDLFAGIGGFHLAFNDLGAKCVFASEWDEAARKIYENNFRKSYGN